MASRTRVKQRDLAGERYDIMVDTDTGEFSVVMDSETLTAPTLAEVEAALVKATKKPKLKPVLISIVGLKYDGRAGEFRDDPSTVIDCELRGQNPRTHALLFTIAGTKVQDTSYHSDAKDRVSRRLHESEKLEYTRLRQEVADAERELKAFEESIGMGDVKELLPTS